jgi:hypothetical protein
VGKSLKSRLASIAKSPLLWWPIGVSLVSAAALFSLYKSDIVASWPVADWPGTEWKICWSAAIFWSLLLICLALLVWGEIAKRKDVRHVQGRTKVVTLGVWISIVVLVWWVWQTRLIVSPFLFWCALIGLLILSAAFSSAETAFTILQEDVTKVLEDRTSGRDPNATTKVQVRRGKKGKPSKFFNSRYNLIDKNIGETEFQTLLSFLLVVANLTNLGGMSLIGKSLTSGDRSNAFSLVISSVVVVIVGEIFAKFVARRLPVRTASATVVLITPLKWLMG